MHDVSTSYSRVWCEHMPSHRHTRASVVDVERYMNQQGCTLTPTLHPNRAVP
jgi:hypothetical protein